MLISSVIYGNFNIKITLCYKRSKDKWNEKKLTKIFKWINIFRKNTTKIRNIESRGPINSLYWNIERTIAVYSPICQFRWTKSRTYLERYPCTSPDMSMNLQVVLENLYSLWYISQVEQDQQLFVLDQLVLEVFLVYAPKIML